MVLEGEKVLVQMTLVVENWDVGFRFRFRFRLRKYYTEVDRLVAFDLRTASPQWQIVAGSMEMTALGMKML